jgi:hypothetical protein
LYEEITCGFIEFFKKWFIIIFIENLVSSVEFMEVETVGVGAFASFEEICAVFGGADGDL